MQPETFFKDEGLVALTSDASIDFTPVDFDSPLTAAQRAYLQKNCGMDIPQVFWRKQIHGDDILDSTMAVSGHLKVVPMLMPISPMKRICRLPYARQIVCRFLFLIRVIVP